MKTTALPSYGAAQAHQGNTSELNSYFAAALLFIEETD
jgi:hypothetical protein